MGTTQVTIARSNGFHAIIPDSESDIGCISYLEDLAWMPYRYGGSISPQYYPNGQGMYFTCLKLFVFIPCHAQGFRYVPLDWLRPLPIESMLNTKMPLQSSRRMFSILYRPDQASLHERCQCLVAVTSIGQLEKVSLRGTH